jgi:hypothetical protein
VTRTVVAEGAVGPIPEPFLRERHLANDLVSYVTVSLRRSRRLMSSSVPNPPACNLGKNRCESRENATRRANVEPKLRQTRVKRHERLAGIAAQNPFVPISIHSLEDRRDPSALRMEPSIRYPGDAPVPPRRLSEQGSHPRAFEGGRLETVFIVRATADVPRLAPNRVECGVGSDLPIDTNKHVLSLDGDRYVTAIDFCSAPLRAGEGRRVRSSPGKTARAIWR